MFFGFGKKKGNTDGQSSVFNDFGMKTNEVAQNAGRESRKSVARTAEAGRISGIKKDNLLEKFNEVRKEVARTEGFDRYLTALEECIYRLKSMSDNKNPAAMANIDGLILQELELALDYCHHKNGLAFDACLSNLDDLVNDRFTCGDYYLDDMYLKNVIARNKYNRELQVVQAQMIRLEKTMEQLKADYFNPQTASSKSAIVRRRNQVMEEFNMLKARADDMESKLSLYSKAINQIRINSVNHADDNKYDIMGSMDDILETKQENEMDASAVDRYSEKLDTSHRTYSNSALGVNTDISSSTDVGDVDEDFFKMG